MTYAGLAGTQFQTLSRGAQGTAIASHASGANINSVYILQGNALDIALKLMLSGRDGDYQSDITITSIVKVDISDSAPNSLYIDGVNFLNDYGITVGDYASVSGSAIPANNFTLKEITGISQTENGQYITIDGVTLSFEAPTDGELAVRSRYDSIPVGAGMAADEVDVTQHNYIKSTFLTDDNHYRFLIKKEIELKAFLGEQIYNPLGSYSVPRKAQSSVGYHLAGLLPGGDAVKTLSKNNVVSAQKIAITRSTSKNFYNSVLYKFDERILEEDKFEKINGSISTDSRNRIDTGSRTLLIESKGLRSDLQGESLSNSAASNRLKKYEFGAEYIKNIQVDLKTGFSLEVGDIVSLDMASLQIADRYSGSRSGAPRLFSIDNKSFNLKTGEITFDLVDTNFSNDARYCLIAPTSIIKQGLSQTSFIIQGSFNTDQYGENEFKKWESYVGTTILIHNDDFTISGTAVFESFAGNTITVATALGFIPSTGMKMDFDSYTTQQDNVKLIYGFMSDVDFADGGIQYQML